MNLEEAIFRICERCPWTTTWFRLGCIIVKAGGKTWQAKSPYDPCPANVEALDCTDVSLTGRLDWVDWDLDSGFAAHRRLPVVIAPYFLPDKQDTGLHLGRQ